MTMQRAASIVVLACAACVLLVGCGSSLNRGRWTQHGHTFRTHWTMPSATSIDVQLTGAVSAESCVARSKGRSEPGTVLIVAGDPAAYLPVGKALKPGETVWMTCQVTGTLTAVYATGVEFKHDRRA